MKMLIGPFVLLLPCWPWPRTMKKPEPPQKRRSTSTSSMSVRASATRRCWWPLGRDHDARLRPRIMRQAHAGGDQGEPA